MCRWRPDRRLRQHTHSCRQRWGPAAAAAAQHDRHKCSFGQSCPNNLLPPSRAQHEVCYTWTLGSDPKKKRFGAERSEIDACVDYTVRRHGRASGGGVRQGKKTKQGGNRGAQAQQLCKTGETGGLKTGMGSAGQAALPTGSALQRTDGWVNVNTNKQTTGAGWMRRA